MNEQGQWVFVTDDDPRNALVVGGGQRPPVIWPPNRWQAPQPPAVRPQALPVYYQTPPQVVQAPAPAPASTLGGIKGWIPDILDLVAVLSPTPAPPVATGDPAKDFNNAMIFASAAMASLKRADLIHTVARIAERRL